MKDKPILPIRFADLEFISPSIQTNPVLEQIPGIRPAEIARWWKAVCNKLDHV